MRRQPVRSRNRARLASGRRPGPGVRRGVRANRPALQRGSAVVTSVSARLAMAVQVMDASSELIAVKSLDGSFIAANRAFRAAAALDDRAMGVLTNRDLFGADVAQALTTSEHLAVLAATAIRCDVRCRGLASPSCFASSAHRGPTRAGARASSWPARWCRPPAPKRRTPTVVCLQRRRPRASLQQRADHRRGPDRLASVHGQPGADLRDDLQKIAPRRRRPNRRRGRFSG